MNYFNSIKILMLACDPLQSDFISYCALNCSSQLISVNYDAISHYISTSFVCAFLFYIASLNTTLLKIEMQLIKLTC